MTLPRSDILEEQQPEKQARLFTMDLKTVNEIGNIHWSGSVSASEQILQTGKGLFTWALVLLLET